MERHPGQAQVSAIRMSHSCTDEGYNQLLFSASCPAIKIAIGDYVMEALVDTGAEVNVISLSVGRELGLNISKLTKEELRKIVVPEKGDLCSKIGKLRHQYRRYKRIQRGLCETPSIAICTF